MLCHARLDCINAVKPMPLGNLKTVIVCVYTCTVGYIYCLLCVCDRVSGIIHFLFASV